MGMNDLVTTQQNELKAEAKEEEKKIAMNDLVQAQQDEVKEEENAIDSLVNVTRLPVMEGDREIIYLHVGKTGGTTLDKIFRSNCEYYQGGRKRKICFNELPQHESVLSHLTKYTVHVRWNQKLINYADNVATSYLFTVRNPIDRAISAFNMDNLNNMDQAKNMPKTEPIMYLKNIFYTQCFPTIEDLASVLSDQVNYGKTKSFEARNITYYSKGFVKKFGKNCNELGRNTLDGAGHVVQNVHLHHNYEFYAKHSFMRHPEKEVLVIRTERMWEDAANLNMALADSLIAGGSA